jgi:uridine kinase
VVAALLGPLAAGVDSSFEAWDWLADRRGRRVEVPSAAFLVIEGVGVAQADARRWASLTAYVHAPWEERLRRGVERDADAYDDVVEKWRVWDAEERALHATDGTRDAADFVIDGTEPILD